MNALQLSSVVALVMGWVSLGTLAFIKILAISNATRPSNLPKRKILRVISTWTLCVILAPLAWLIATLGTVTKD